MRSVDLPAVGQAGEGGDVRLTQAQKVADQDFSETAIKA